MLYAFAKWPLFKFLDFLFGNEVLGYNDGIFNNKIVNGSSIMNAMNLRSDSWMQ